MKKTLKVKDMHCSSCEMLIKDVLDEREGVKNVQVSLKSGTVTVEFDEKKLAETEIKKIIKDNGYGVE